jgi:hypothetical protein
MTEELHDEKKVPILAQFYEGKKSSGGVIKDLEKQEENINPNISEQIKFKENETDKKEISGKQNFQEKLNIYNKPMTKKKTLKKKKTRNFPNQITTQPKKEEEVKIQESIQEKDEEAIQRDDDSLINFKKEEIKEKDRKLLLEDSLIHEVIDQFFIIFIEIRNVKY